MQSINVYENGIGYLAECLGLYLGGCAYLLLFAIGVAYILIRGNEEEREIFIPITGVLIITVYNPVFPIIIDKFFDISSEYYRFFWITPVIILVPFVVSKIISEAQSGIWRKSMLVFVLLVLLISGRFVYEDGIVLAQNIYKIPDELIQISEIIHADSDQEYAKAFFEYEYNMEIRQYDPKMLLSIDREEYIYAVNYSYSEEMIADDNVPTNRLLACLIRGQEVAGDAFVNGLELSGTEYIVLTKGNPQIPFIESLGLKLVGDTATHCIYKYELSEKRSYDLVDYSNVEHKFSYRRLK